jgi:hypothetical protein
LANNLFLHQPVGPRQPNDPEDVKVVQAFLNKQTFATHLTLTVDGHYGPQTERAIYKFQRVVLGIKLPDGIIPVAGSTLDKLKTVSIAPVDPPPTSVAIPLRTDAGAVVKGASGEDALVPQNFNIKAVLKSGDTVKLMTTPSIWDPDGRSIKAGLAMLALDLDKFPRSKSWDIQRLDGTFDRRYIDGATILIGMYAASAGMTLSDMLFIENRYAVRGDHKGATFDPTYTNLPPRNVRNTEIGYELITSGKISPK